MNKWKIPLYKVFTDNDDLRAVSKVIKRGMEWANGPEIEEFEKNLSKYLGTQHCVTFNSGTSSLHASLLAVNVSRDNDVIVPSFTFISTANSSLMVNAKPKFVDIENETLGLNPQLIEKAISKKTKAILPVHYAGLPCNITAISQIAKRKKIVLIEDAAESLGATIKKKKVGTFGDLSIFSFAGNKVLTTGEGGVVTTNSKKLYKKLKLIRSHGREERTNYFLSNESPTYVTLGYNWRMSSITAALANSQLDKLEKLINMRRKNAKILSSKLRKFRQITIPNEPNGYRHVYQLYSVRLTNSKLRDGLMKFLSKKGIMSKIFFDPIHLSDFFKKQHYSKIKLPVTKKVSNQILSLPMYPGLKNEEINYIYHSIGEYLERN